MQRRDGPFQYIDKVSLEQVLRPWATPYDRLKPDADVSPQMQHAETVTQGQYEECHFRTQSEVGESKRSLKFRSPQKAICLIHGLDVRWIGFVMFLKYKPKLRRCRRSAKWPAKD